MSNVQCALGLGHTTRHENLLRMDFNNATCLMDCMKTNLVKVCMMASVQCVLLSYSIIIIDFGHRKYCLLLFLGGT